VPTAGPSPGFSNPGRGGRPYRIAEVRRKISFPLLDLSRAMLKLAANDTSVEVGHTGCMDEIGEMARAVVVFRANAIDPMHSQPGLAQQATMLQEKLAHEQSVTQMQRNFVSMITHEFRTPLTRIDAQAQRCILIEDHPVSCQCGFTRFGRSPRFSPACCRQRNAGRPAG
jgi:signal transduction histidine kinase